MYHFISYAYFNTNHIVIVCIYNITYEQLYHTMRNMAI